MPILLGIDFETTGLDPKVDQIIEVGFCLFDSDSKTAISMGSTPCRLKDGEVKPEIEALTGLNKKILGEGLDPQSAVAGLLYFAMDSGYIVAHNAGFERSFMAEIPDCEEMLDMPWIDTMTDLPYPAMKGKGSLSEICMVHGVFNPMPHRALFDAVAMMQLLSKYDFADVERYAAAPTVNVITKFPYNEGEERRKQIKSLGFQWNDEGKCWKKPVKAFLADQEVQKAEALGFTASIDER